MILSEQDKELLELVENHKKWRANGWKMPKIELEQGADIVIIDKERKLQSITVWKDITNIERLKRLCERKSKDNCIAIPVIKNSLSWGEIYKPINQNICLDLMYI